MVTFGKKTNNGPGNDNSIEILLDGKSAGEIVISYDDLNSGTSIRAGRYVVDSYEVQIFAVDDVDDVRFDVRKYDSARSALSAAKEYAKRVLTPAA